ncbi:MAG: arylsulfotransferase family protein [Solirubrobacteraceae bacterium]
MSAWVPVGLLMIAATAARAAAPGSLEVIPFPGTPDASPQSQIIFGSLSRHDLRSLAVRGSRSGRHGGRIVTLPARRGVAFVPTRSFVPGERVEVTAALSTAAAAPRQFSFSVARPVPTEPSAATARIPPTPTQTFHSQVDFHPPVVKVTSDPDTSSGDIFLTPNNSPQVGPLILDSRGRLVWFRPLRYSAFNLEVQKYRGRRVLTWWQGRVVNGHGAGGKNLILDRSYRQVAELHGGYGYSSDLHEFQITPQGTALIDAYVPVRTNLSSVGGPRNGTVLDCVIQELDIRTGRVLWEWHALGHVPLTASYRAPSGGHGAYDYFHLNSIQQQPGRRLLISARNTWSVYLIGERTGKVIWTLGGKRSSFRMGSGTNFEWQHDARLHGHTLSVFNDAGLPQEEFQSSAKRLDLNRNAMTARLRRTFTHAPPLLAGSEGNAQLLLGGKMFVGWGSTADFSEYSAAGRQIFNGTFVRPVNSYRAYRFHWSGHPRTRPPLAVVPGPDGSLKVYASWNGATEVTAWRVLGGDRRAFRGFRRSPRRQHFESMIRLRTEPRDLAVQALDSSGHVLGTSRLHRDPDHLAIFGRTAFVRTGGGFTTLPVGCLRRRPCRVTLTISSGGSALGGAGSQSVPAESGGLIAFKLSSPGRRMLQRAAGHRLRVQATVRASELHATTNITLIPYSVSGTAPPQSVLQSPSVQIARTVVFVSPHGAGSILAACYAPLSCHIKAGITAGGAVIATRSAESLGAGELGPIQFRLTPTGRAALARATGNQLAAQVTLSNGRDTATGHIVVIGYR